MSAPNPFLAEGDNAGEAAPGGRQLSAFALSGIAVELDDASPAAASSTNVNGNGTEGTGAAGMQAAVEGVKAMDIEAGPASQPNNEASEPSGSASWLEASYHTVTAVVGAGVLGLPYAFSKLGWAAGVIFLFIAMSSSLYTSWLLATMHEMDGVRYNRYRDLGSAVLGPLRARLLIAPFQFAVMVGLGITYTLTGAQSMQLVEKLYSSEDASLNKYIFIFAIAQVLLSQIPDFANLWWVSVVGALMSALYSTLAGALALAAAPSDAEAASIVPSYQAQLDGVDDGVLTRIFVPMGQIMFAYGGHSVLLEIQATLRTPPPAKKNMMKGVYVAYLVSAICYYWVACTGYASYGSLVAEDVLLSEPRPPRGWIAAANIMVVLHVLASFQVYSQPVFEAMETGLSTRCPALGRSVAGLLTRLTLRSVYVLAAGLVAACLPFFGDLMGLIGAIGFTPMTYIMPSVLWLVCMKGRPLWERGLNWTIAIFFTIVGLLAFIGSAANVADKSSRYDVWSS